MFWKRKTLKSIATTFCQAWGKSNRRRHQQFVRWAIVVGILVSALVGGFIYYTNRL